MVRIIYEYIYIRWVSDRQPTADTAYPFQNCYFTSVTCCVLFSMYSHLSSSLDSLHTHTHTHTHHQSVISHPKLILNPIRIQVLTPLIPEHPLQPANRNLVNRVCSWNCPKWNQCTCGWGQENHTDTHQFATFDSICCLLFRTIISMFHPRW